MGKPFVLVETSEVSRSFEGSITRGLCSLSLGLSLIQITEVTSFSKSLINPEGYVKTLIVVLKVFPQSLKTLLIIWIKK